MILWALLLFLVPFVSSQKPGECSKPNLEGMVELTDEALMMNEYPSGTVLTLECAFGYREDQGSTSITCTNGNWSKQELTCKKKDCGDPKPLSHMRYEITNGTLLGALIKPVCDEGYYLQGSSYRQCIATGWSGRSKCLVVTCGKLPEIPHSVITVNLSKKVPEYKDIIEYSCEQNYTLVGTSSISCQHNGTYSSPPPKCKLVTCGKPPVNPHSVIVVNLTKEFPEYEDIIEYSCEQNYTLVGNSSISCQHDGNYSSPPPKCIVIDCGDPKPLSHMQYNITNGTLLGAVIKPVCDKGYYLQGTSYRQCIATGWSGRSKCLVVTCGRPPVNPHSVIAVNLTKEFPEYEDIIEYSCEQNYTLVGNSSISCQHNGTYSSPPPKCKLVTCGTPPVNPHSVIAVNLTKEFPEYEDIIEYSCEQNYTLVGNSSISCQHNGTYSSPPPKCKLVTCETPPVNPHSVIAVNLTKEFPEYEVIIEYSCEQNYTLVGNSSISCQHDGNYSSPPPKCIKMEFSDSFRSKELIVTLFAVAVAVAVAIIFICIFILLYKGWKQRNGSYDTGEGQTTEELLLQKNIL